MALQRLTAQQAVDGRLPERPGQAPAAVLADLLGLHPTTAVKWMHQAGADWTRYAAEVARTRNYQPGE